MPKFLQTLTGKVSPGQAVEAALSSSPAQVGPYSPSFDPSRYPVASPWSSGDLQRVVFNDVFGSDLPINTRNSAMRIPAIARARNLVCTSIARNPLVAMRGDEVLTGEAAPTWTYRTNLATSPQLRMAWTVDDLIFTGWSCWWRENGSDGFPLMVDRIARDDWTINDDMRVEVNGTVVRDDSVILIPGLHEGVLSYGADALADARGLYAIVRDRIKTPIPAMELHQTGGDPLDDDAIDALIARWAAARRGDNAGVGYTNEVIELKPHGEGGDSQLLIEARNAAAVDMARLIGVSAGMIDATAPKASLNYETQTGRNQEFTDLDLALYTLPIVARLSLDDVVPAGQRIAFDLSDWTGPAPSPTGPALED